MEFFNYIINFFGIPALNEVSTLTDLLYYVLAVFVGIFLFTFVLRSLFLLLRFGER